MFSRKAKQQLYLSLVWKAILSVSFATFIASGAIVLFGKFTLDKNYEQERARVQQSYQQAFEGILEDIKSDRVDLGWVIPALIETSISKAKALKAIKKIIAGNWFQIELESDIESAFLFTKDGRLVGKWGNTEYEEQFKEALQFVATNESPYSNIICLANCIHFHASPFLHNGEFLGIFIFGIDLADIVLQMKHITGSNVGILTQNSKASRKDLHLPNIEDWSANILALTEMDNNSSLLRAFSKQYPSGLPKGAKKFDYNGRKYEFISLPFKDNNHSILLIIEDITDSLTVVSNATALYAVNGLLSLLLSGGILLLLFIGPTQRLKNLVNLFPLIAKKQYSLVINLFKPKQRWLFRDEIDILESAAHDLIDTLKELDEQVIQRTLILSTQTRELQKEKNFIDKILDTTQVIILTIDSTGLINSANKYAEHLTGYQENDLLGKKFTELFMPEEVSESIQSSKAYLVEKRKKTFQFECSIHALDGTELYISWFLSPLIVEESGSETDNISDTLVVGLDLTERKKSENQLTWLAEHDPLTSLYNRRKFEKELEQAIAVAARYDHTSAIIFFDIDQFKYVNDSSGHQVGDELLVKVAEKLQHTTRKSDIVARFGGDEFIILAPNITQNKAEELVQKLCTEMTTVVIADGSEQHRVSVSAGLLMFPEQNCSAQDLLASVDIAMYRAKEQGRGGWRLANHEDINRHEIRKRVTWKTKIEKALEDNRFVLHYQPIMHIADKSIAHYECLLRMVGPAEEIIPPGLFIETAEQTGLIFHLDQRVLELAFLKQSELIKQGHDIKLSINLSGEMLSNRENFNIINRLLETYHLDANRFIFEVTETQAVTSLHAAHDFITRIKSIGGSFALDDFGVGFSSMNYLKQLPVNYLKIDGSFIRNITSSHEDQLFVNAINSVGQGMGIKTIAEFVENQAILDVLAAMGIDYAQGYGIGKPMPELEFHYQSINDANEKVYLFGK
jgi:diguanylate cyclase (GGDEF)-like protein/PAS domain S-box-containing protein